jgi:hypothetical protein
MRSFIPTMAHAVLDYVSGILITASPWLFGFAHLGGAPLFIPLVFGSLQVLMVIFTKHELGLIKVIPIQTHLFIDMIMGFFLFVSPFLYKFYPFVVLPHVVLGLFLFASGIFTRHSPFLDDVDAFDPKGL